MTMTWTRIQKRTAHAVQKSDAFDLLFQQNWEPICKVLFNLTGDWHEAEDMALETFLRLYEKPPEDQENVSGWLYRVATNLGLNALRARKRRQNYENQAAEEMGRDQDENAQRIDPELSAETEQERQRVREALARMRSRSATLLLLRYGGFSYSEIAAALEISPGSVGTLLVRAEREFAMEYQVNEK
jgi:RNA polymerase sigma-70 factor, ECF subfamily